MIDINKEAEEYGWRIKTNSFSDPVKANDLANSAIQDFIAGYNSKATQAKVLQAKIDILQEQVDRLEMGISKAKSSTDIVVYTTSEIKLIQGDMIRQINNLQQQLKGLENG